MSYVIHIFYGIVIGYLGLISPGMLNMTILRIRINTGKYESLKFAGGASVIVLLQAGIALFFADFFVRNPRVIEILKVAAIFVFIALSVFFFFLSRKKFDSVSNSNHQNYFRNGVVMSLVNMLAIPFYLGISIYLASVNKIIIEQPFIVLFVTGVAIGSFLLFYTYIVFAEIIIKKVSFIATNINIILSVLFFGLGILTLIRIWQ
ncbi:MAG: hypothetical protein COC16_04600 [Lutibacter sp.]|nr:MAG: hypothetical protein COC16_04600 [Lutibacter sp.]PHS53777.1 MAG: hypothetical protein COB01_03380 [Lutibacter sp.]